MGSPAGQPANVEGAATLLRTLVTWGVEEVFTCPGSTEAAFLDATLHNADLDVVLTTHDSVAVAMADGAARVSGRPAVAYLHANVGLANGVAHLTAASLARSPILVLSGLKHRTVQARRGFTTVPHMTDYVRQHVKLAQVVQRRDMLAEELRRAFQVALAEPTGPVWLGIPEDVMEERAVDHLDDPARYRPAPQREIRSEALEEAARQLVKSSRPVIVAGDDLVRYDAVDQLRALAERLGAPVMSQDKWAIEWMAFPTTHPLYVGPYDAKRASVQSADAILLAGARFNDFVVARHDLVPPGAFVVQCHGNSAEIARRHPVDAWLPGDVGATLRGLDALVAPDAAQPGVADTRAQALEAARREWLPEVPEIAERQQLDIPTVVAVLDRHLQQGGVVVDDSITASDTLFQGLHLDQAGRYLSSTSGSMGWGVGASLGVQQRRPDEWVVSVIGDGVFQFGIPALWTAVRHRLPVTLLVVNNEKYAAVEEALTRYGGEAVRRGSYPGTDISGPNLAEVANAFGARGVRLTSASDLDASLAEARRERSVPTVIEAMVE